MVRSIALGLVFLALVTRPAIAEAPPPGWYLMKSQASGAIFGRDGSDSDLLLELDFGGSISATETSARELAALLTETGECGAFGAVKADPSDGMVLRAETTQSARPSCNLIIAERANAGALVIVGKTISAVGSLEGPRAGAESLLALRTGRKPSPPPVVTAGGKIPASPSDDGSSALDGALKTAMSAVPKGNVPVRILLHGEGSFIGWPASYVYTVTTHLYFANGYMTRCADWDPGLLSPTPESLGRLYPECGLARWRKTGTSLEVQDEEGLWSAVDTSGDSIRRFSPGERVDVNFGNVGGAGFGGAGAVVSVNTLFGEYLLMTSDGQIAVGEWSTTVLSGATIGGGGSGQSRPIGGRYYLDGHLIAIAEPDGAVTRGFIVGVNENGVLGHIYLNGRQFWNRDD